LATTSFILAGQYVELKMVGGRPASTNGFTTLCMTLVQHFYQVHIVHTMQHPSADGIQIRESQHDILITSALSRWSGYKWVHL